MNKLATFLSGDFKLIFRDRMLCIFLFAPLLLIAFVRFFIPYLSGIYPQLEDYHPLIMMFGSMQTAILFGFIASFMILEEKDEHVLQAIRVLPLSSGYFLAYRLTFATFFSFFGALFMILFAGLAYPGLLNARIGKPCNMPWSLHSLACW